VQEGDVLIMSGLGVVLVVIGIWLFARRDVAV
jgi:hypothetical protein